MSTKNDNIVAFFYLEDIEEAAEEFTCMVGFPLNESDEVLVLSTWAECREKGHDVRETEGWATPDSGGMTWECARCGQGGSCTLY